MEKVTYRQCSVLFKKWMDQHTCGEKTKKWHKHKSHSFLEWIKDNRYRRVDPECIKDFLGHLKSSGLADPTVLGYYRTLRASFRWGYLTGVIKVNPMDRVPAPRMAAIIHEPFTPAEVVRMLEALRYKGGTQVDRDIAIILLLYDSGLRSGGLRFIRYPRDIDLERRCIKVTEKGNRQRLVSYGSRTAEALEKHIETRADTPYLFVNKYRKQISTGSLYRIIQRACVRAGVRRRKLHLLRNSFAGEFLLAGGSERGLQLALGHTTPDQTFRVYAKHVEQQRVLEQMQKYSPADRLTWAKPPMPDNNALGKMPADPEVPDDDLMGSLESVKAMVAQVMDGLPGITPGSDVGEMLGQAFRLGIAYAQLKNQGEAES